ncbi:MAG TPA: oligoendopeptidase F [Chloroflexaceae bacterium]|nr:oligoendopeptidase F [Chloroflexaceae bacterium]
MSVTLRRRAEVPGDQTWDLESVYPSRAAWEADAQALEAALPELARFKGRLAESSALLLALVERAQELQVAAGRLYTYASMAFDVDTTDQGAAGLRDQAIGLFTRLGAALAFVEPELLASDPARLDGMLAEEPALGAYAHYFANLRRRAPHVRSGEVEQLLAHSREPLSATATAYLLLAEGDLRFADARDGGGAAAPVATGTIDKLLQSPDRALRRSAWASFQDGFLAFANTFGALYAGSVRADVFQARARGHASALEASLFSANIPQAVYNNVIDACNRHLPIWHRYWEVRRRALGLERLEVCDIFAPLAPAPHLPYAEGVALVVEAVAPLGEEYAGVSRAGLTGERWVDIYPNQGKTSGAYSGGGYDTRPFILMNYDDTLVSVSTLAHELGHSMHTWHANRAQPPLLAGYSLFAAEVASNFNQALLRATMLAKGPGPEREVAIIEEAMANFHRYLFLMPILSQFEQRAHARAEAGEPLTAEVMGADLAALFERGYGPAVRVDPARDGVVWAQFPHLYSAFYVYQYASGIAAANALADGVLRGEPGARERYLSFLSAGGALYPLDALRLAGSDMATPEPLDRAFAVLEGFVGRLEQLVGAPATN